MFRRWKVAIPAAAVVFLLVGAGVWILFIRDEGSGSEKLTADLPPVTADGARATLSYLDGEGAALMRMHETASDEPLKDGRDRCEQVVQRLDSGAPPQRIAALTDGVADEPLRAAFGEERLALGVALTRCVKSRRAMPEDETRLTRVTDLSTQRLDQLRAAAR